MNILYDMRSGELVKSKLFNNGLLLKDALKFDPMTLFAGGKQGVWYDPSDKSTLFQDIAGTIPVTKDGDPVALIRDKSGNDNHATQAVSTSRPIYKTDGILHWLAFDGVDDSLSLSSDDVRTPFMYAIAFGNVSGQRVLGVRSRATVTLYQSGGWKLNSDTNSLLNSVSSTNDTVVELNSSYDTPYIKENNVIISTSANSGVVFRGLTIAANEVGTNYTKLRFYGLVFAEGVENNNKLGRYLMSKTRVTL